MINNDSHQDWFPPGARSERREASVHRSDMTQEMATIARRWQRQRTRDDLPRGRRLPVELWLDQQTLTKHDSVTQVGRLLMTLARRLFRKPWLHAGSTVQRSDTIGRDHV